MNSNFKFRFIYFAALLIIILYSCSPRIVYSQDSVPVDSLLLRLEQIAASDSATSIIHNNLGFVYLNLGRPEDAITQYTLAIKKDPDYAEAYNNLGYAYSAQGQITKAVRAYQDAIRHDPEYADAYNNIGLILMNQNKINEAILQFRRAVEVKPDYHFAWGNMGYAYFKVGMLDSAITFAHKATEIHPAFAEGYNIIGLAYFQQRKREKALEEYKRAVKVNPSFKNARYNLALTYSILSEYEKAVKELEILIQQAPSNILYAYQLSLQYYHTMDMDKSEQLGRQIVRADSTFLEAFLLMGRIAKARGNDSEAREFFLHAIKLNPKIADPWYNLGVMDVNANLLVAAEEELLKAKSLAPERIQINYALGLIYLSFQDPEKAIDAFEGELKLNPNFEQAKQGIADAKAMKKRFDEAAKEGKYRARLIMVKTKKEADALLKRLKASESFTHLAFSHSILPSSGYGGDVGFLDPDEMQPEMVKVLKNTKVGSLSKVIKTEEGYQILLRLN